jgi:hypothetical protein
MTSVSFIAPYAPQPAASALSAPVVASSVTVQAMPRSSPNNSDGKSTDHSGSGAGNGTGTGGALTGTLLERRRQIVTTGASPKSIVEAQTKASETAAFLAGKQEEQAQIRGAAQAEALKRAETDKAQKRAEDLALQRADQYRMPNPLPTAPILQEEQS